MGKTREIFRGENCQTVLADVERRNRVNYLQGKTKKKDEIRRRMLKSRGGEKSRWSEFEIFIDPVICFSCKPSVGFDK